MSYDNPAAIVTSAAGVQVGVINDGVANRLQVDTRSSTGCAVSQPAQGVGSAAKTISAQLANGTTTDLQVNGATTPVVFSYAAPATSVTIYAVRLIMSGTSFSFANNSFGGSVAGALGAVTYAAANTKGVLVGAKSGGVSYTMAKFLINEDMLCSNGGGGMATSSGTVLASTVLCNQTLIGGSTDAIIVTVQDNLTNHNLSIFRAYAYGVSA